MGLVLTLKTDPSDNFYKINGHNGFVVGSMYIMICPLLFTYSS